MAGALEGRLRLLVFDNCEHVRDAAADLVEAILAHSATVGVLATSREGLGVGDEQRWLVSSLDVGAGIDSAAVNLFVERARSVAARFSLGSSDEAGAVVEICRRLDGIPLAIELAASRMASMTPIEVRDRLDQRFRLLVGSRRGLARHQALRHAVAWSYDHLDDAEKDLLERCSVFAGGFDLQSACAVAGSDDVDDYAVLDLLDALVRKSLLIADRSAGRTRFSMPETIRQFAQEQLVARGEATQARTAHACHFAGREADIPALSGQPPAAGGLHLVHYRAGQSAHRVSVGRRPRRPRRRRPHRDVRDVPRHFCRKLRADRMGRRAHRARPRHRASPPLVVLYMMASQCYLTGRPEAAVRYNNAQMAMRGRRDEVPYDCQGWLGGGYVFIGQPERSVEWCRAELARGRDTYAPIRATLVITLTIAGSPNDAMVAADGLVDAAEATRNPHAISYALLAYGFAFRDTDPDRA